MEESHIYTSRHTIDGFLIITLHLFHAMLHTAFAMGDCALSDTDENRLPMGYETSRLNTRDELIKVDPPRKTATL